MTDEEINSIAGPFIEYIADGRDIEYTTTIAILEDNILKFARAILEYKSCP